MLPECRSEEYLFSVPEFSVTEKDVDSFIGELKCFHDEFKGCFHRSETRKNFFSYMVGQFSDLERKSIEPIALTAEKGQVRSMQRAISDAIWDEKEIFSKYRSMVDEDMGDPSGVVIFDESGFVKKGQDSAGVKRQYCGNVGKVENSQVGVFAAYASPHGYALLDKELYIPEQWFSDEYEKKRKKCRIPENLEFKTKPMIAAEMLRGIHEQEIIRYKYVVADSVYGHSPDFIETVEGLVGKTYLVSVSSDTLCWLQSPATRTKPYKHKGEVLSKKELVDRTKKPIKIKDIAANLNSYFWYRRMVSEGTKGPIEYEFNKKMVVLSKNGLPWKVVWLIMRRTVGENPTYSFFISNAPESAKLSFFVWLSGIRWAIEQCFEETKTELGLDQYEVRKYPGWNHHMLTAILGHFFLWHLKIRLEKKSSGYYSVAA